jgi:hypothetical protein
MFTKTQLIGQGRGGVRKRPPLILPPLPKPPKGTPVEEWAVTMKQAAELTETTFQNWHRRVEFKGVPAYIGPGGRKYILIADLSQTRAAKREGAKTEESLDRARQHERNIRDPWPGVI